MPKIGTHNIYYPQPDFEGDMRVLANDNLGSSNLTSVVQHKLILILI